MPASGVLGQTLPLPFSSTQNWPGGHMGFEQQLLLRFAMVQAPRMQASSIGQSQSLPHIVPSHAVTHCPC
jgi:hypothetical protein